MRTSLPHTSLPPSGALAAIAAVLAGCSGTNGSAASPGLQALASPSSATTPFGVPLDERRLPRITLPAIQQHYRPPLQPLRAAGAVAPMTRGAFISTAQYYGSDVVIYSVSGSALPVHRDGGTTLTFYQQLTAGFSFPLGAIATSSGDLYIANTAASNLPVYHFNRSGPHGLVRTLSDSGEFPVDVDSTSDESLVAVSNYSTTSSASGSVSLYAGGSTTPTATLSVADTVQGAGIALDQNVNCYWAYQDLTLSSGFIVEFPSCTGSATTIVSGMGLPGGLAFDKRGNLYYVDQTAGAVYKCHLTSLCAVLKSGFVAPVGLNFDAKWQHLWLADSNATTPTIYAIDPASGTILSSTPAHNAEAPFGIAPEPGAKY